MSKKNAQTHQQPSQPQSTPANQQPSTASDQGHAAKDIHPTDKQYPVAVKEMPPKEIWDKMYVCFTGALVAVAIATLIAIWIQAVQTRKAAEAAKESAKAAKMTADVMMVSMLPQLSVGGNNLTKQLEVGGVPRVELIVENKGDTDALQCRWESWIEIIPADATNSGPACGFSPAADHFVSDTTFPIFSRSKTPVTLNIPIRNHTLSADELTDLKRLRTFLCVRLLIRYRTVFDTAQSDEDWYFGVGLFVLADGFGFLSQYGEYGKKGRQNPN